jgi:choline dehydrogenase
VYGSPYTQGRVIESIGLTNGDVVGEKPTSFTIYNFLLNQISKGYIRLYKSDPMRAPEYDFKYLSEEIDVKNLTYAYKRSFEVLKKMGLTPKTSSGADAPETDEGILDYIKKNYGQAYHWVGGCRMGTSICEGVVNSDGLVFGTNNLYVADASIFPESALGNAQMNAYLAGNVIASKLLR